MLIYIDGTIVPEAEAKISVLDHGLLYGDGVFEGIRVYDGKVFRLEEHLERLDQSARSIMMYLTWSQEELTQAVVETVRANELRDAYVRLIVTRGIGDLGLDPQKCENPSLIVIATGIQLYPQRFYEEGLKIIFSSVQRMPGTALDPQAKTLNYLNSIQAKIEAKSAGVHEAIMLNSSGYVVECTADNIFVCRRGRLSTPPANCGALEGITRGVVIELCQRLNIPLELPLLTKHDIYTAEECFLTGTAAEVVPVVQIDGRQVGDGKVGPVTRRLMEAFREETREGVSIYKRVQEGVRR